MSSLSKASRPERQEYIAWLAWLNNLGGWGFFLVRIEWRVKFWRKLHASGLSIRVDTAARDYTSTFSRRGDPATRIVYSIAIEGGTC